MENNILKEPQLFMILLGSKAKNRNVEQHDYFFGISTSLYEMVPRLKAFWPEAGDSLHIDGWRIINKVDGYHLKVVSKDSTESQNSKKLFFINLGGYQHGKLEEQHYTVFTVQDTKNEAVITAKKTIFFKTNSLKGAANSHIDEKYGIDVDDIYRIEDILPSEDREQYSIAINYDENLIDDEIHLGYLRLNKILSPVDV